jgi:hypothetical protein
MTGYEVTCLKSFVDHGHRVIVYAYDPQQVPDLFEAADAESVMPGDQIFYYDNGPGKGSISAFSNLFRYALCATFGDWWIDTDVVCLSADWPENDAEVIAGWEHENSVGSAILRLDGKLASKLESRARILGRSVRWGKTGPELLTKLIQEEKKEELILPQSIFYTIPIDHWYWFHSDDHWEVVHEATMESLAVHLWHEFGRQNRFDKSIRPSEKCFFGHIVTKHDTSRFFGVSDGDHFRPFRAATPLLPQDGGEKGADFPGAHPDRKGIAGAEGARLAGLSKLPSQASLQSPLAFKNSNKLPLVSFVVVNHNYGRFLRICIDSILSQNYCNIECVIVDNASTDDSSTVLNNLTCQYPLLKILRNDENVGQTAACCAGFALTKGSYIAFVDADDYLLPNFTATHIRAHLTLHHAVGFTSGDMMEMVDNTVVLGYPSHFRKAASVSIKSETLRDIGAVSVALGSSELESAEFAAELRLVPKTNIAWVWSPTSGTVYRRDAVRLFADNQRLKHLRFAADCYFNYPINALTGSVLIERPLAVYRIHGNNSFTTRADLDGTVAFDKKTEEGRRAAFFALEHMVAEFDTFFAQCYDIGEFWSAMHTVQRKSGARKWRLTERVLSLLMRSYFRSTVKYLRRRYGLGSGQ